jgi:sec-independent protein translocase protein TatA
MFGKIGTQELLVIFAIVLVVFGPKQLPKLGKTFGKTIKGFKDGIDADNEEDSNTEEN